MRRRAALTIYLLATVTVVALHVVGWIGATQAAGRRVGFYIEEVRGGLLLSGITPGQPADRAGLVDGDVLVAVDGVPVRSETDYDRQAAGFARDRPVRFRVLHEGAPKELAVRPGVRPPWRQEIVNLLLILGYLAIGGFAIGQATEDLRARLLAGFSVAVALEFSLPDTVPGILFWPWVAGVTFFLISGMQMGLELHLASVIPRRFEWTRVRPWLTPTFYVVGATTGLILAATYLSEALGRPLFPWSIAAAQAVLFSSVLTLWAVAVPAILFAQARLADDPRQRNQATLVLMGVLPWTLMTLVTEVLELAGQPSLGWIDTVQPLALAMYPVAVLVAMFRYNLFDIELVIKRSLVYGFVTVTLVLMAYGVVTAAGLILAPRFEDTTPVWLISSTMLILGLLFAPLRKAAQTFVDRRFFPERLAMRRRLTQLAAHLPAHGNLPEMGRELVGQLREIFSLSSATLLVADPQTRILMTLATSSEEPQRHFEQSYLLEPDDPGVVMLGRAGRPLRAEQAASQSATLRQRFEAFGVETAQALLSGSSLVGLILLGPKVDGERLVSEELELLTLFSHMVATVLENAHLFQSATYESLTGLLRREAVLAALDLEFERAVRYGRPLAVGMADIDRFKQVNDTHGHLAGDAVLKLVAQTLKTGLRASDTIGRYGGEEFLFFLPETDLERGVQVAEKLRSMVEALRTPVAGGVDLSVTVSIGVASLEPRVEESSTALVAAADECLYRAKSAGRNRVVPPLADDSGST